MVSAKKKQMSEAQLLKAKQAKLKENEKMLGKFTHSSNKLIFPTQFFLKIAIPPTKIFQSVYGLPDDWSVINVILQACKIP